MTHPPPPSNEPDSNPSEPLRSSSSSEMSLSPASPSRTLSLLQSYSSVLSRIKSSLPSPSSPPPRLVLVSKLKPASDILSLHRPPSSSVETFNKESENARIEPALHFGENYHQELLQKSRLLPSTIKWHFIGGLQSNKCVALARDVRGLWAVESVDSEKKAQLLDKGWGERRKPRREEQENGNGQEEEEKLRVFIQVNTSGEESKSGVAPDLPPLDSPSAAAENGDAQKKEPDAKYPLLSLASYILTSCPHLHLQGLMTIGAIARSRAAVDENEDFTTLRTTRDALAKALGSDLTRNTGENGMLELSMGMSDDFEAAIKQGSHEVRIGSTIFGARPPKGEAKVLEATQTAKPD